MNSKLKLVTVTIIFSANAHAQPTDTARSEQVSGTPAQSGIELSVGQCVLSVQHLYKRITESGDLQTISLAEAKNDPGCRKLRDYTEVEKAYSALAQQPTAGETRVAKSGVVFTRDTSIPGLGEAYRDPSGLIWGDVAKKITNDDKLQTLQMTQNQAEAYCKSIGARLPTKEEFGQLRTYLGRDFVSKDGTTLRYSPYLADGKTEVLPGISNDSNDWFWSSSPYPYYSDSAFVLNGVSGNFDYDVRNDYDAVRCVSGR